jgi:hypothetical protein
MDSKPSIAIVELNGETRVEICQIVHGMQNKITVNVKDFGNFMFILKSIDSRMRNKSKNDMFSSSASADLEPQAKKMKPTETIQQFGSAPKKDFQQYEPETLQQHEQYDPVFNFTMDKGLLNNKEPKSIRDDMLEIICEQFCNQIQSKLEARCTECMLGIPTKSLHSVCKLSRKEKIDLVFDELFYELDEKILKSLLAERRWNGVLPYNETKMYINKDILVKNGGWVKKLKNRIERFM